MHSSLPYTAPSCGLDDDPSCGLDDDPSCGLDDDPSCGLDDDPSCRLDDDPSCGLDDDPSCGLEDDPSCGLDDDPSCRLDDDPSCGLDDAAQTTSILSSVFSWSPLWFHVLRLPAEAALHAVHAVPILNNSRCTEQHHIANIQRRRRSRGGLRCCDIDSTSALVRLAGWGRGGPSA